MNAHIVINDHDSDKSSLFGHYSRKYAHESSGHSEQILYGDRAPIDRYEACVYYAPRHFPRGDILELAAGSGRVARGLLAGRMNIMSYTASEWSEPRLDGLRRSLRDPRARVISLNAEQIPDDQLGRYDAVIMIALLEHLVDPLRAMCRIRALLRPGGMVYIDTPNIAKITRRLKLLAGRFPATASRNEGLTTYYGQNVDLHDEGHLHYFTYRSLSRMLTERCGFSSVTRLGYWVGSRPLGRGVHHAMARLWPSMFSELTLIAHA